MSETVASNVAPSLSISIVCYHPDLALLKKTLDSVYAAVIAGNASATLSLVDNGNQQSALASLLNESRWQPNATLISNPVNVGFGAANNQVILMSTTDYHLVLNPDVEVEVDALAVGLHYLKTHPDVVAVSPACVNGSGEVERLCKRYPSVLVLLLRGFTPRWVKRIFSPKLAAYECEDLLTPGQPIAVPLISGCFILARTNALKKIQGFDEKYFLYFEDFALSRALSTSGELHHVPSCKIVHHGGYAARKGLRHILLFLRSAVSFFQQHGWKIW